MTPAGARVVGYFPRHVPMTPGLLNSLLPGLFDSLDWTPGLLFKSLAWTPGLLKSLPPGLTPVLLFGVRFSDAPGRGALDDECCTSVQVRFFVGVFIDTS